MAEMTVVAAMVLQRMVLSVPAGQAPPRPVLHVTLRPHVPLTLCVSPAEASITSP
jgi:unspecific monooxygenase